MNSVSSFKLIDFASAAGPDCYRDAGAAFASFEKYAAHFSNHAFGMTEPKEAPYTGTGENAKQGLVK
jgi:hypothetical protein